MPDMDWMQLLRQMESEEAKRSDPQSQNLIRIVREIAAAKLEISRGVGTLAASILNEKIEKLKKEYEVARPK